jgi:hypothetical protein
MSIHFVRIQEIKKVIHGEKLLLEGQSTSLSEFKKLGRPITVHDKNIVYQ